MRRASWPAIPARAAGALLLAVASGPAFAVDGVLEINQACVAAGCFPGDAAGFPVSITQPGSYRLTGNLTVPDENTTAIEITASDVDLDLNGFTISGVTVCSGIPVACSPTGTGHGVSTVGAANVAVHTGTVRAMGAVGLTLAQGARVDAMKAIGNGSIGIHVDDGSLVSRSEAADNGDTGISAGLGATVERSRSHGNGGAGIRGFSGVLLMGNSSYSNAGDGIAVTAAGTIQNNTVFDNTLAGITMTSRVLSSPGAVIHNAVYINQGAGIVVDQFGLVTGNTVQANGGTGLDLGNGTGYAGNVVNSNTGGTVTGGVQMGTNVCDGNTTCP